MLHLRCVPMAPWTLSRNELEDIKPNPWWSVLRPDSQPYPLSTCALRHGHSGAQPRRGWRLDLSPLRQRAAGKRSALFAPEVSNTSYHQAPQGLLVSLRRSVR
jgi:hypothetical protein